MTQFLVRHFIKHYEDIQNAQVRQSYGTLSSCVGIFCNIILFGVKLLIGLFTHSVAIASDAFNNLSDCGSCVLTLFGYRLAARPADKDHPFGHGRYEYLTALILSIIILLVGIELLRTSFDKILHPETITFSWVAAGILVLAIGLKLWMSFFNKKLGSTLNNEAMKATAKDSMNDVLATTATLLALILSLWTTWPVDGLMGLVVSLMVLWSGIGMIRDTLDELLGKPASKELVDEIERVILSHPEALGVHDMIIHDYGPGKIIGSCHVEVNAESDFLSAHDMIDDIERDIGNELHVMMTIHMDPVETQNEKVKIYKEKVQTILTNLDPDLTLHDFRIVAGPSHTNLVFDVLVPYTCKLTNEELKEKIDEQLQKEPETLYTVITFDKPFYEK